jgi:hypothetical protein
MSTTAEDRSPGQVLCTSSGTPQGGPAGTEPERRPRKAGAGNRREHLRDSLLDQPVQAGRHPQQTLAAPGLGDHHPADRRRPVRTRVQGLADLRPVLAQPRNKLLRGHAVHTRRARIGPDTPQRPAQILRREQPLPQAHLQTGDDSIPGARRPAATLSCGAQRNSPSPPGSWPASAGWLRSPRPARATPIPPSHLTFGPSRPLT